MSVPGNVALPPAMPAANPNLGSVSGGYGAVSARQDFAKRITHIEIRRVQNGFVLMGYDFENHAHLAIGTNAKVCMIANTAAELGALLESIITGSDLNWLPSIDLPITGMFARVKE